MKRRNWIFTLLSTLLLTTGAYAQSSYTLGSESVLVVEGTSNVRDWDGHAGELSGTLILAQAIESIDQLEATTFQSLTLDVPVRELRNDNNRLTNNMHSYLKRNDHPVISFRLTGVDNIERNGNVATLTSRGEVSVAGVTLPVTMRSDLSIQGNGTIQVSGSQDMKMTDFGIDPPVALLGTIRAVDDVQVHYTVQFTR